MTDIERYYRGLRRRQDKHLERVHGRGWKPCLHDQCPFCIGTHVKINGGECHHEYECDCQVCNPVESESFDFFDVPASDTAPPVPIEDFIRFLMTGGSEPGRSNDMGQYRYFSRLADLHMPGYHPN